MLLENMNIVNSDNLSDTHANFIINWEDLFSTNWENIDANWSLFMQEQNEEVFTSINIEWENLINNWELIGGI